MTKSPTHESLPYPSEQSQRIDAAGWNVVPCNASTIDRIVSALERRGVECVRLTKKPRP